MVDITKLKAGDKIVLNCPRTTFFKRVGDDAASYFRYGALDINNIGTIHRINNNTVVLVDYKTKKNDSGGILFQQELDLFDMYNPDEVKPDVPESICDLGKQRKQHDLLKRIRDDLLMRGEVDSNGCTVVDISSSLWIELNDILDKG